ncbi:short-chain dehydrogenase, partial [Xanthomonas perforans]|nr:short-chain dehydrogenase [Xanthomonas perforans]
MSSVQAQPQSAALSGRLQLTSAGAGSLGA